MKSWSRRAAKRGLTLIELVIVVAILGVLAAMLLPKFEGLQTAANHAAAAGSATDAARLIESYKAAKTVYPNYWDSLLNGTSLWTAANVGTKTMGLDTELVGNGATVDKLILGSALTTTQSLAMSKVGITTITGLTATLSLSGYRPGDMFTTAMPVTGAALATINAGSSGGKKIIDHIYPQNLQPTGSGSGTINPTSTISGDTQLIVFGLGPQNSLVPNSMMEAPTYGNDDALYVYNRLLAVFELTGFAGGSAKCTFRTMLGGDGDLISDMSQALQTSTGL
ncbi:MAG TPA: type II secretion system protein [Pirellulales bacterium]|jgi:prepilin-type N-terminal cleavage/methylation domain-containing protein|nr:type II secretion system protein [Pirellulales bacterium]